MVHAQASMSPAAGLIVRQQEGAYASRSSMAAALWFQQAPQARLCAKRSMSAGQLRCSLLYADWLHDSPEYAAYAISEGHCNSQKP